MGHILFTFWFQPHWFLKPVQNFFLPPLFALNILPVSIHSLEIVAVLDIIIVERNKAKSAMVYDFDLFIILVVIDDSSKLWS